MTETREARRMALRTGFRTVVVGTIDRPESTPPHVDAQAAILAARHRITLDHARQIAELMSDPGRRR